MFEYNNQYYNTNSAEEVVPIILKHFGVNSVLDVGCGIGTWLKVFKNYGIDVFGIENYQADKKKLFENITEDEFIEIDISNPFNLNRKFDLVISLEVGEHLEADKADIYIKNLIQHGNIIIFSAAIPEQGGDRHINEQWNSYWSHLFEKYSYYCHDIIRPSIWNNENVEWWYKQNIFVYNRDKSSIIYSDIIHPKNYIAKAKKLVQIDHELKELQDRYNDLLIKSNSFKWLLNSLARKIKNKIFRCKVFQ